MTRRGRLAARAGAAAAAAADDDDDDATRTAAANLHDAAGTADAGGLPAGDDGAARARPRVSVTLDSKKNAALGKDALLSFDMALALGEQELSREEAEALLNGGEGLMLLRGDRVEVDGDKLRQALAHWETVERQVGTDGISFIEGMRLLAGTPADLKGDGATDEAAEWAMVRAGDGLRETLAGLRSPADLEGRPPAGFNGDLRHYQVDGLNWLFVVDSGYHQ